MYIYMHVYVLYMKTPSFAGAHARAESAGGGEREGPHLSEEGTSQKVFMTFTCKTRP